ncbi:MAG: hypothetical protein RL293_926 [Bacteroidota bacterium]
MLFNQIHVDHKRRINKHAENNSTGIGIFLLIQKQVEPE